MQDIRIIEQGIMQLRDELALLAWAFTATGEALLPAQLLGRQPPLDGFCIGRLFFIVTIHQRIMDKQLIFFGKAFFGVTNIE